MSKPPKTVRVNGREYTMQEIAEVSGLSIKSVYRRVRKGVRGEALFQRGSPRGIVIRFEGRDYTPKEAAQLAGASEQTIRARIKAGLSPAEIMLPPKTRTGPRGSRLDEKLIAAEHRRLREAAIKAGEHCKGCGYYLPFAHDKRVRACHYCYITGHGRGEKVGDGYILPAAEDCPHHTGRDQKEKSAEH